MRAFIELLPYIIPLIHLLGILTAADALYIARSSESAIAWGLSLVTFPYLALPLYWVFGRHRFVGYREREKQFVALHQCEIAEYRKTYAKFIAPSPAVDGPTEKTLETIAGTEFTTGNQVELLIDGEATFSAIFSAIEAARDYVLVQFFIIHDDGLGHRLKNLLIERARAGVKVCFLFDELGSGDLSSQYLADLRAAGVQAAPFATRQGIDNFFQLNFRNHRKIVIVDGCTAFVGGHNVGDRYLGLDERFGRWRDTHIRITGPEVLAIQAIFVGDWFWATRTPPPVTWSNVPANGQTSVLTLATGPVDDVERCQLFFLEAIHCAKKRLWISSPYFVPSPAIVSELQLAAMSGVDVRILLPEHPDHYLVWLASFSFIPEIVRCGVKVLRYSDGFLHQKVVLVDDNLSAIGTANLDNRSMKLNFEVMMVVADANFADQVSRMLTQDMESSVPEDLSDFDSLPLARRLASKFARLFSPIL